MWRRTISTSKHSAAALTSLTAHLVNELVFFAPPHAALQSGLLRFVALFAPLTGLICALAWIHYAILLQNVFFLYIYD